MLCAASGVSIVLSTALHGAAHGWLDAFGAHEGAHAYPFYVLALYSVAIVTGAWFVLPKAFYAARSLRPDMNLLMIIAVMGAVIIGDRFFA